MALVSDTFPTLDEWLVIDRNDGNQGEDSAILEVEGGGFKATLPLTSRNVEVDIDCESGLAEVKESFRYRSTSDCSATFRFPLPSKSAVCRFEAQVGEKTVKCQTKRKSEADREFTEAVSQGHTAVKLSQQSNDRIFQIALGNLAAGEACTVRVEYIQLVDHISRLLEYTHTATWVPPYVGGRTAATVTETEQKSQTPAFASKVAYSLTYSARIHGSQDLTADSITCATHRASIQADSPGCFSLHVSEEVSDPSKDFQLSIAPSSQAGSTSTIQMQTSTVGGAAESTILATFRIDDGHAGKEGPPLKQEMLLVIDCSGSMGGDPIQQATEAACFFIRDLPVERGIRFNVVRFGSRFVKMWEAPKEYDSTTEAEALAWLKQYNRADLGGTEMMAALRDVYATPLSPGWERQVMLLTDGGVNHGENQQLWDLVTSNKSGTAPQTHVFPLGIGYGIHRPLLDGVASRSGGASQYVVESKDIATKMGWLSKAARSQNRVYNPRLVTRGCLLGITPSRLPTILWPDSPLVLLAAVRQAEKGAEIEMVCEDMTGKPGSIKLPLPEEATSQGTALRVLHAMSSISELLAVNSSLHVDDKGNTRQPQPSPDTVKDEVVRLAVANNLVTPHTSSVGVMLSHDPLDPSNVTHHEIPIQLPHGRTSVQIPPGSGGPFFGHAPASSAGFRGRNSSKRFALGTLCGGGIAGSQSLCAAPPPARAASFGAQGAYGAFGAASQQADAAWSNAGLGSARWGLSGSGGGPAQRPVPSFSRAASGGFGDGNYDDFLGEPVRGRASRTSSSAEAPEGGVLSMLSQLRETAGFWKDRQELFSLLPPSLQGVGSAGDVAPEVRAGLGVGDLDAWATLLVLAWLTKRCRSERALWGGMWDKAVAWLQGQGSMKNALKGKPVEQMVQAARAHV